MREAFASFGNYSKPIPTYIPGLAFALTGGFIHVTAGIKLICADTIVTNPHWNQHWVYRNLYIKPDYY
jgi:hypothetical protein